MINERYNFKISKNIPDNVLNKTLYINVKKEVKKSVKAWPSAYASAQLVHLYKKRGGKYARKKKSGKKGLHRWFEEKWINVCALPKIEKCGRSSSNNLKKWKEKYPYCRPMIKVNKSTPKLESKLTRRQIKSICKKKRENPTKKIKLMIKKGKVKIVREKQGKKSRKPVRKKSRKPVRKKSRNGNLSSRCH